MILVMSMMGDLSNRELAEALIGDYVMIITGLGASVTSGYAQGG
jgi:bacteriorhodopsin